MSYNKYNREYLVGSGTFGNVWLVTPQTNQHTFVMKEVKLVSMTEREREQALTEVLILSKCQHKNIIKYEDAIYEKEKGMLCIIMEYAEGGDLYTVIANQKGKFFEEHCIIDWFIQICLALEYIHSQNILHRDLKSQNIFLTKSKLIKVGDFGIARVLKENHELATTAIGTPYYLSPEICQRKPYSFKSDIWALGCVLFEMSALTHPFQAKNFNQLALIILNSERRDLPKHCGPLIEHLVDILLKSDPEERPSTSQILSIQSLQFYLTMHLNVHGIDSTFSNRVTQQVKEQLMNMRRHSANDILKDINEASGIGKISINTDTSKITRSISFKNSDEPIKNYPYVTKPEEITYVSTPKSRESRIPILVRRTTPSLKNLKPLKKEASLKNCSPDSGTFTYSRDLSHIGNTVSYRTEDKPKAQDPEGDGGYHSADTLKRSLTANMLKKTASKGSSFLVSSVSDFDDPKTSVNFDDCNNVRTSVCEGLHCLHAFQCNQCMVDFLWKNRIRSDNQVNKSKQSKLRAYLHSTFGNELFDKIYYVMISEWETDHSRASEMLTNLIKHLTVDQVQHIPLVVQLIQLDLVTNYMVLEKSFL